MGSVKIKKKVRRIDEPELSVCSRCGAIATQKDQLCKPERFEGGEECTIPERRFNRFPAHGNCAPVRYVCAKCGRQALSEAYLCEGKPA